jgi:outer membrane receptor protein involved in Fe transport
MDILQGKQGPGIRGALAKLLPASIRALALVGVAALISVPAHSQVVTPATAGTPATSDTAESAPVLEQVVITGSRIPQPNLSSISPIQVVSAQDIQLNGVTDITSLMNILPQNFQNASADLGPNQSPLTSAGGISTADLRGLGPQRTLVLVDGRRLGVGDASTLNSNPAPDLNQIPAQLVERIDVVTGGASAVYGSDAIAGVVNFVMKHDFQGIEVDAQGGVDEHGNHDSLMQSLETQAGFAAPTGSVWDGQSRAFDIIMGTNFADGNGNIEAYATYRNQNPVTQGSRDFSGCLLHIQPGGSNPNLWNQPFCDGSPNSNLVGPVFNPNVTCAFGLDCLTVSGTSLLPWPQAGSSPPGEFNSEPYEYLETQDTRYNAGFFSHYDINDYVKPFLDFSFMRDETVSDVAPGAAFLGENPNDPTSNGGLLVNCAPTNPLLSAQENAVLCNSANGLATYQAANGDTAVDTYIARRNIEGGPRISDYQHENFRVVAGAKGDFGGAWNYEAYGSYYSTSLFQAENGYLSWDKIQNALLVVTGPNGTPVCQGGQPGCVPWNIWTQGGVTPAQAAYLAESGSSQGTVTERILSANVTGELGKYGIISPLATDGLAINLGLEHRSDQLQYSPDQTELGNDLAGFGGAGVAVDNGYHVSEEFIELRAPLIQHQPGAELLSIGLAGRHSDYSTAGNVNTYKFDVQYAPINDVLLRYSFDRAIRAPNIIELFTPQSVTNTTVVSADPCAGATPSDTLAQCARTGVTAAEYGHIVQCPAGQCSTLLGGNPNLAPEVANTLSFGATFTPSFLSGFSASLDYYKIILRQEVSEVPQDISLNSCLDGTDTALCSNIVRSPSGLLFGTTIAGGGYITATNQNIAVAEVSGVDAQFGYHWSLGAMGSMQATFTGTYMQHDTSQPLPVESTYDCAGLYGATCQTVNPRWRHIARVTWNTPVHVLFSAQWRYIGASSLDSNTGNPELVNSTYGPGAYDSFDARLPSISYLDLTAAWQLTKNLSIHGGVNNVLDKDPPLINEYNTPESVPNTFPTYDVLGRVMFFAFTAKF